MFHLYNYFMHILFLAVLFLYFSLLPTLAIEVNKQPLIEPGVVLSGKCQDGATLINKMVKATAALDTYSSNYQMKVYEHKRPMIEKGVIYFHKPHLLRVEVKEGPKKGALAILCADGKVHGHLGGALKFFNSSVPPDSILVRAINGFPMVGTDFLSLAQYLKNMSVEGDKSLMTLTPLLTEKNDLPTYILDMYTSKNGKIELLKRIYVNHQTFLPVFWEDYRKGKLWSESSWNNLKCNINLPDSLFKP